MLELPALLEMWGKTRRGKLLKEIENLNKRTVEHIVTHFLGFESTLKFLQVASSCMVAKYMAISFSPDLKKTSRLPYTTATVLPLFGILKKTMKGRKVGPKS